MELVRVRIPFSFIKGRVQMNWSDILFGLDEELIDPAVPTALAAELVGAETTDSTLVELAGLGLNEDARQYVETLASREREDDANTSAKWLYLVLAWIFENRQKYEDPLRAVEEVYADFGYPPEIASFVRYMPSDAPDQGTQELNETRLFEAWDKYLQKRKRQYAVH